MINFLCYITYEIYICIRNLTRDYYCNEFNAKCKDMNKLNNRVKVVTKISTSETLLTLQVGVPVTIPNRTITTGAIRTAASRLDKAKKARFLISTDGLVNETKVIRLR